MRHTYIVSYDVSDAKRLRETLKIVRGYGQHLQFSVFRCELDAGEKIILQSRLREVIHRDEDQVLFINLGPSAGRAKDAIEAMGRPWIQEDRGPAIF